MNVTEATADALLKKVALLRGDDASETYKTPVFLRRDGTRSLNGKFATRQERTHHEKNPDSRPEKNITYKVRGELVPYDFPGRDGDRAHGCWFAIQELIPAPHIAPIRPSSNESRFDRIRARKAGVKRPAEEFEDLDGGDSAAVATPVTEVKRVVKRKKTPTRSPVEEVETEVIVMKPKSKKQRKNVIVEDVTAEEY